MIYIKHIHVAKEFELYRMEQGPTYTKIGLPKPFKSLEESEEYVQDNGQVNELYEIREITRVTMKLVQE